jgi:hypothetical protein
MMLAWAAHMSVRFNAVGRPLLTAPRTDPEWSKTAVLVG